MLPLALVLSAYLIGSIPFSYLVVRVMTGADLRQVGSRNIGATNVARSFGKAPGVIALFLDMAKGYAVIVVAGWLTAQAKWPLPFGTDTSPLHSRPFWIGLAGLIAVAAHMFPLWLRFHGGKGVATATGVFLALDPIVVAAGVIIFLIVLIVTRFVSLASILSAASIPIFMHLLTNASFWTIVMAMVIATMIIIKHHSNIARLTQGSERRMGQRKDQ